jgi:hypothetical protein
LHNTNLIIIDFFLSLNSPILSFTELAIRNPQQIQAYSLFHALLRIRLWSSFLGSPSSTFEEVNSVSNKIIWTAEKNIQITNSDAFLILDSYSIIPLVILDINGALR